MKTPDHEAQDPLADARLRSGTAARLAGLPVSTLRVWERRYAVVDAPKCQDAPTDQTQLLLPRSSA